MASSISFKTRALSALPSPVSIRSYGANSSVSYSRMSAPSFRRLRISCAAKPETVEKVCGIVVEQLALKDDQPVSGETKFTDIGADSLDTVEIVMKLEEEFGVTVQEESAQAILTIGDAAQLIEELVEVAKKN